MHRLEHDTNHQAERVTASLRHLEKQETTPITNTVQIVNSWSMVIRVCINLDQKVCRMRDLSSGEEMPYVKNVSSVTLGGDSFE